MYHKIMVGQIAMQNKYTLETGIEKSIVCTIFFMKKVLSYTEAHIPFFLKKLEQYDNLVFLGCF